MLSITDSSSSSHDHQKGLQIKQDDKFFSRLMSKDTSMANSSSRVYYRGASGAVPFIWESQPGTPKHPFSDTTPPPLTPPPSYNSTFKTSKSMQKKSTKPMLLISFLPRLLFSTCSTRKKIHTFLSSSSRSSASSSSLSSSIHGSSSSSSSSSSTTLSSSSSTSSSVNSKNRKSHRRGYFPCSRSPHVYNYCMKMEDDDDDDEELGSIPTSTLYFGVKRRNLHKFRVRNMKKALLSIVGHGRGGSGQGTTA